MMMVKKRIFRYALIGGNLYQIMSWTNINYEQLIGKMGSISSFKSKSIQNKNSITARVSLRAQHEQ
jgi:hypothetical protein